MSTQRAVALSLAVATVTLLAAPAPAQVSLQRLGTYRTGIFNGGASEIADYDPRTQRLFIVNGSSEAVDVVDVRDPSKPTLSFSIFVSGPGLGGPNSVAVRNGVVAVAVEADPIQDPGVVRFFDTAGTHLSEVRVGALPDMLTFTPDGTKVLVANEGEPDATYTDDPEGTVSIIDLSGGVAGLTAADVTTVSFAPFNGARLDPSVRIFGPGASVAQDVEPEYIAVSADSGTAWVTLQENNAIAVIDVDAGVVTDLVGLGFKNHRATPGALDASDRDGGINIRSWPVHGMFLPDGIAAFQVHGQTYLITANEGDSRDYDGFSEEARVGDLPLDATHFPDAATLQLRKNLGRLKVTTTRGDFDGDGDYDALFSFGARSFSLWTAKVKRIFDSGDDLEQITAADLPAAFNSDNTANGSFDSRSDDKGPEPEGVAVGEVDGRTYAFIGCERIGGVFVYDVSVPAKPRFIQYVNPRDFAGDAPADTADDLGPEGVLFIPADDSPTGDPLVVIANEISGSTSIYRVVH